MDVLQQLTPNLMVDNVNETVKFYQEVLGFSLVMSVPETGTFLWAMMSSEKVSLMFQERKSMLEEYPMLKDTSVGGGLTFYIKIKNVRSLYNKVQGRARIVLDLHKTFYGAEEFALQDPNGFVLTFAGDAESAEA
ncbi:MAG: VOC family protein [Pelosinus sp.]|nr:VOC family protein [Pelosinus sp.]